DDLHGTVLLSRGRGVGQQGDLAGVLHRDRDVTLVLPAVAGDPAGPDLAAVGDELPQQAGVLVVDVLGRVLAERADLLLDLAQDRFGHGGAPGGSEVGDRLERRLVVGRRPAACGRGRAPRVVVGGRGGPTTAAASAAAAVAAAPATAGDLVHLRGGVAQRGADLVDLQLDDSALL